MRSLSRLPPSVRGQIYQELIALAPSFTWPQYAAVSRELQSVVESFTFSSLHLVPADLHTFRKYLNVARQGHLQNVTLFVSLPTYSRDLGRREEDEEDHTRSSRTFTQALATFLEVLSHWDPDNGHQNGVHLTLDINSVSDDATTASQHRQRRRPPTTDRARTSVLQIDVNSAALPEVRAITALTCQGRHIELLSTLTLMSKLKGLEELDIEFEHDTKYDRDVEQRHQFVLGLDHYASNVTILHLRRPMNIIKSDKTHARQSRSLFHSLFRTFTQQCTWLSFDDCVDIKHFLDPFKDGPDGSSHGEPGRDEWWPHLFRLEVRYSWMVRRPYLRVSSRANALLQVHEIMLLLGRATRRMPSLHHLKLRMYILGEAGLQKIKAVFEVCDVDGTAKLAITGIEPTLPTVEAWKKSARDGRELSLEVTVDAGDGESMDED